MKPGPSFDAVIVGAGIVGAACAKEFADGGLRVAVCEASGVIGGGATAAGMGHLAVMDDSEPQFALTSYSQRLWAELRPELPREAEYLACGSLWIATDDQEMAEVHRKHEFYSQRGVAVEMLDAKQLAEAEPHLRPEMAGALLMPADSVCYPPCVARYLVECVQRKGGEILLRSPVVRAVADGVHIANGDFIGAGLIVLATGAAAQKVVPDIEVRPRKGHLVITDRYPNFVRHQLIELGYLKSAHSSTTDSVAFNAQPRITGQILIGSSRQYGVEDGGIDEHILRKMLQRAIEYMPDLGQISVIRSWTGFRAATPDKLPLIGRYSGSKNLYLATGHEGLGISTSLATARLLADEILNRPSEIPRGPYQPDRTMALHA